MNKLTANIYYGWWRVEPPGIDDLKGMFYASVLSAIIDDRDTKELSRALHDAYVSLLVEQADASGEELLLIDWRDAEQSYLRAAKQAYGAPAGVDWDGATWHDVLPCMGTWEPALVRDLGHLVGYYEVHHDEQLRRAALAPAERARTYDH